MITNIWNIDLRIDTIRKNQCKEFKRINENVKNIQTDTVVTEKFNSLHVMHIYLHKN